MKKLKKKSHRESDAALRKHVGKSADPFSLPSKWKHFQPSPSGSEAAVLRLTSLTHLLCWQDPRVAQGSLAGTLHRAALSSVSSTRRLAWAYHLAYTDHCQGPEARARHAAGHACPPGTFLSLGEKTRVHRKHRCSRLFCRAVVSMGANTW